MITSENPRKFLMRTDSIFIAPLSVSMHTAEYLQLRRLKILTNTSCKMIILSGLNDQVRVRGFLSRPYFPRTRRIQNYQNSLVTNCFVFLSPELSCPEQNVARETLSPLTPAITDAFPK